MPLYYLVLRLVTTRREADRLFMWIVAVHAILFRALANPYNYVDTRVYASTFKVIGSWTLKHAVIDTNTYTELGRGYLLYNWILSRVSNDPSILFVVTGIIAVGGIMLYYKKTAYTVFIPVLFYLSYHMMYIHGFGVIRQHLAIPFLLFALYYINNTKQSFSFALLATLLHTASAVFFPFLLMHKFVKRMDYREVTLLFIIFFVGLRFFASLILSYSPRYAVYLRMKYENMNSIPVLLILFLIVLLYEANVFEKVKNKKDYNILLFILYGFALSLFCIGLSYGGRLSLPVIYLIPSAMSLLYRYGGSRKDEYNVCTIGLFILVFIGIYFNIANGDTPYAKYSFFWQKT